MEIRVKKQNSKTYYRHTRLLTEPLDLSAHTHDQSKHLFFIFRSFNTAVDPTFFLYYIRVTLLPGSRGNYLQLK